MASFMVFIIMDFVQHYGDIVNVIPLYLAVSTLVPSKV